MKVRLYDWDGKTLKEGGILENNKGVVSALAFSPDGAWLAAGDVNIPFPFTVLNSTNLTFHSPRVESFSTMSRRNR